MVLYTIVPPEIIFNENKIDEGVEMSNNKTPRSMEINYFGEKVQVLLFSDDSMIVDRIITSNFKSHLNPALQPGMTVDISKVFDKNNL